MSGPILCTAPPCRLASLSSFAVLLVSLTAPGTSQAAPKPPVAARDPKFSTAGGERREDDYGWLREKKDPKVIAYLEAENAYTDAMTAGLKPLSDALYQEILGRIQQTDLSVPYRKGGYFYYSRTQEGRQYPIHCRRRGTMDAPEEMTLDLNALAEGHEFMALGDYEVSPDGTLLAYTTDSTGFRQYALSLKDLRTGRALADSAERVTSVAWSQDGRTLFYVQEDETSKRSYRLYRHTLGAEAHDLVYEEKDERFDVGVERTRSGEWIVQTRGSHTTSEVAVLPAARPEADWTVIAPRVQDREYYLDHHGDRFWIRVNDTGRTFRLVSAPVETPDPAHWAEVVPRRAGVMLTGVECFRDHFVMLERERGLPQIAVGNYDTGAARRMAFPEPAYNVGPSANAEFETGTFRYTYQSFVTPPSVYDLDVRTFESALLKRTPVLGGFDPARYAVERIEATAKDGTRVPISLVRRRDLPRDGSAPCVLYGYGSYGISSNVGFSTSRVSLLDRGVVYAIAHIRGGGDLGKAWHDDARMASKMNTFTDYIACAEHLVHERYTASDRLVITGGSAGGLLMGAVANMRPELFHAVVTYVPFVDVINTMLDETLPLTVGEFEEWGNPRISEQYAWMRAYSPYDNLAKHAYPAMLVRTGLNDSQVMYWEPAKYVARLRTLKTDQNPLLFKINMGAGHGGASGRYDAIRDVAFDYAWILEQVGLADVKTLP